jgi:hypothetical protein
METTNTSNNINNKNLKHSLILIENESESIDSYLLKESTDQSEFKKINKNEEFAIILQLLKERVDKNLEIRFSNLEKKFRVDLDEIENMKYEFYENLKKCKIEKK